jgi:hypothetical protein
MRAEPNSAHARASDHIDAIARRRESSNDDASVATTRKTRPVIAGQPAGLNQDAQLRIWESRDVQRSGDSGFAQTRAQDAQLRIGE